MHNIFLIPARDAQGSAKRVPDPETGDALADTGAHKPRSQYWLRRLAAGDVTEGAPNAATETPAVVAEVAAEPEAPEPAAERRRKNP